MLKVSRRWGAIAWLLCMLIVSASLDRIADPPAVNPHGSDTKAACIHHIAESAAGQVWAGHGLVPLPQFDFTLLGFWQFARPALPGPRFTEMRHAGGPSPPNLL